MIPSKHLIALLSLGNGLSTAYGWKFSFGQKGNSPSLDSAAVIDSHGQEVDLKDDPLDSIADQPDLAASNTTLNSWTTSVITIPPSTPGDHATTVTLYDSDYQTDPVTHTSVITHSESTLGPNTVLPAYTVTVTVVETPTDDLTTVTVTATSPGDSNTTITIPASYLHTSGNSDSIASSFDSNSKPTAPGDGSKVFPSPTSPLPSTSSTTSNPSSTDTGAKTNDDRSSPADLTTITVREGTTFVTSTLNPSSLSASQTSAPLRTSFIIVGGEVQPVTYSASSQAPSSSPSSSSSSPSASTASPSVSPTVPTTSSKTETTSTAAQVGGMVTESVTVDGPVVTTFKSVTQTKTEIVTVTVCVDNNCEVTAVPQIAPMTPNISGPQPASTDRITAHATATVTANVSAAIGATASATATATATAVVTATLNGVTIVVTATADVTAAAGAGASATATATAVADATAIVNALAPAQVAASAVATASASEVANASARASASASATVVASSRASAAATADASISAHNSADNSASLEASSSAQNDASSSMASYAPDVLVSIATPVETTTVVCDKGQCTTKTTTVVPEISNVIVFYFEDDSSNIFVTTYDAKKGTTAAPAATVTGTNTAPTAAPVAGSNSPQSTVVFDAINFKSVPNAGAPPSQPTSITKPQAVVKRDVAESSENNNASSANGNSRPLNAPPKVNNAEGSQAEHSQASQNVKTTLLETAALAPTLSPMNKTTSSVAPIVGSASRYVVNFGAVLLAAIAFMA